MSVSPLRVSPCNSAPVNPRGEYVLHWTVAARRLRWGFALDRAIEHAWTLGKHASDRRPAVYSPADFEAPTTHDEGWNAA